MILVPQYLHLKKSLCMTRAANLGVIGTRERSTGRSTASSVAFAFARSR
jgi:hypothetical protein